MPAPDETADGADRQLHEVLLDEPHDLGSEFYRWEFATAVAGAILGINPFDQPNVQEAKDRTRELLASGKNPANEPESSVEELLAQPLGHVCAHPSQPDHAQVHSRSSNRMRATGRPRSFNAA